MQRSRAAAAAAAAEGMLLRREKELVAQLQELLFPTSPPPAQSGGGSASSSSGLKLNVAEHYLFDESLPPAPCGRRRGRKRDREDDEQDKEKHGDGAEARCSNTTRKKKNKNKKQGTRTLVTTVPDFDGYQWRKYGQKQIEAAKYTRSYYRCTNSADQGCPAKRTVQRNDDDDNGGGPPKYTVVYISEHTCKATAAPPVILETTVRCVPKNPAADHDATAAAAAAHVMPSCPDVAAVVPAESASTATTRTASPAISDITWSSGGDTNPSEYGDYSHVFAADDWDTTTTQTAVALLQEMDFAGPIRSPVHDVAADCFIDGLFFVDEPISTIPSGSSSISSYHFFGF